MSNNMFSMKLLGSTILIFIVYMVYKASLPFDFVWDDREVILNNIHIKDFLFENIIWAFSTTFTGNYQPLTWLSFMLDHHIWGLNSYGYRLTNILIHSLNACVLMAIVNSVLVKNYNRIINDKYILLCSLFGALIYCLHPLRIESVVWVTERKDVLSGLFILLSFYNYLKYKRYILDLDNTKILVSKYFCYLFFSLSLLCKAWAITYPVLLVLLDISLSYRNRVEINILLNSIKENILFFLISIIFAGLAIFGQGSAGAMVSWESLTVFDRLMQAAYGFNMYLFHTVYPLNLSPLYLLGKTDFSNIKYLLNFILFISIFFFSYLIRKKNHWPLFFFLMYLIIISPVLGFTQSGAQIMADRYTYIALMPFSYVIAWSVFRMVISCTKFKKYKYYCLSILFFSITTVLTLIISLTIKQLNVWENEETLWTQAIDVEPFNYLAINNRADYRVTKSNNLGAYEDYTKVISIDSNNAYAYNGRTKANINLGRYEDALGDVNSAIEILPSYIDALINRAVIYNNTGYLELSKKDLEDVLGYQPEHLLANFYLGINYFSSQQYDEAIRLFNKIISINSEHIGAIYYKGYILLLIDKPNDAKKIFEYILGSESKNSHYYKLSVEALNMINYTGMP